MTLPAPARTAFARGFWRLASWVLDPTVILSFGRSGFQRHARLFSAGDLAVDLSGRRCLVTGANSGIGKATARALALAGAEVHLLCRSAERGQQALEELRAETGSSSICLHQVDLSRFGSIRRVAEVLRGASIDALVHNAGVLPSERSQTEDGHELTLATNLLGPFLLTQLLLPELLAAPEARVVFVSSGGMLPTRLSLEDFQNEEEPFDGVKAYSRTKRAQVVLAELLADRLQDSRVSVHSMHPGWADTPAVRSSIPRFYALARRILRSPAEGADTVVWLCVASIPPPDRSGGFWFDRRRARTHLLPWTRERAEDRQALWTRVHRLCGLDPESAIQPARAPLPSRVDDS